MIFPTDYRERIIKEEKSRQYKAMLDEQIRDNYLLNQQRNRKSIRIRTEPSQVYDNRSKTHSSTREIPHETTFLPSINSSNIIDHGYKYGLTSGYTPKRYVSQIPSRKQTIRRHNDEDLDDHLDKCLQECDNLINGINKNFINLNNHFRINQSRRKEDGLRKSNARNNSDFDLINNQNYKNNKSFDNYPLTNLKDSELIGYGEDVGRNEMMNYNILKAKEKFQYFSPQKKHTNSSPSNRDGFDSSFDRSQQRTKRKNPNDFSYSKTKNSSHGYSHDFDTINSYDNNEFTNSKINMSKQTKQRKQDNQTKMYQKKKQQEKVKRQKEDEAAVQEMKKKDDKILEHLRRAKNRGNILFKKIEVFKKQRQEMERAASSMTENYDEDYSPSKAPLNNNQNTNNNGKPQSKNTNHPNEAAKDSKQSSNKIQSSVNKQIIPVDNNKEGKKQEPKILQNKEKQTQSRASHK